MTGHLDMMNSQSRPIAGFGFVALPVAVFMFAIVGFLAVKATVPVAACLGALMFLVAIQTIAAASQTLEDNGDASALRRAARVASAVALAAFGYALVSACLSQTVCSGLVLIALPIAVGAFWGVGAMLVWMVSGQRGAVMLAISDLSMGALGDIT
ncbi:MAG: hypothetical protein AAFR71_15015 [Pseudomonadota bacterium]